MGTKKNGHIPKLKLYSEVIRWNGLVKGDFNVLIKKLTAGHLASLNNFYITLNQ